MDEEEGIRYSVADGIGRSRVRCSKMRNQAGFTAASEKNRCENRKTPLRNGNSNSGKVKHYTYIIPARRREVNEN